MLNIGMVGDTRLQLKTMKMEFDREKKRVSEQQNSCRDNLDCGNVKEGAEEEGKLQTIRTKLQTGGKLTQEERNYLKVKDPERYTELVQEEQEEQAYRQAIRGCRTMDRQKLMRIGKTLATIKEVEHNSEISQERKLDLLMREQREARHAQDFEYRFVTSGEYKKLPTDEEWIAVHEEDLEKQVCMSEQKKDQIQHQAEKLDASEEQEENVCLRSDNERELTHEIKQKVHRAKVKAAYAPAEQEPLSGCSWSEWA